MSTTLANICSYAGVPLPGHIVAVDFSAKHLFSRFFTEKGTTVVVRATTTTKLADAYKALCAIIAERRAYKALPATVKRAIWLSKKEARRQALRKKKLALRRANEKMRARQARERKASLLAIRREMEKEPSRAQVKKAQKYWATEVEAKLPPRATEAQCLLAKYRAWRNKQAKKACISSSISSSTLSPPVGRASPAYPFERVSSFFSSLPPPCSPLSPNFGVEVVPQDGVSFSFPLPSRGMKMSPLRHRLSSLCSSFPSFSFNNVGRNVFISFLNFFRVTPFLVQNLASLADSFLGRIEEISFQDAWLDYYQDIRKEKTITLFGFNFFENSFLPTNYGENFHFHYTPTLEEEGCTCEDCNSTFWLEMVSPVTQTGSLVAVFNDYPVYNAQHDKEIMYLRVKPDFQEEDENCTCVECCSLFFLEVISPVRSTGSLEAVFNNFPVVLPNHDNEIRYFVRPLCTPSGCSCDECHNSTWLDYVSPVHRTGSLKAVFNNFPVCEAAHDNEIKYLTNFDDSFMGFMDDTLDLRTTEDLRREKEYRENTSSLFVFSSVCEFSSLSFDFGNFRDRSNMFLFPKKTQLDAPEGCDCWRCKPPTKTYWGCEHTGPNVYECFGFCKECDPQKFRVQEEARGKGREDQPYWIRNALDAGRSTVLNFRKTLEIKKNFIDNKLRGTPLLYSRTYSSMTAEARDDGRLAEEASLASEQIESNFDLLTPAKLIELAGNRKKDNFLTGEGKHLENAVLKKSDLFFRENFFDKIKRHGLGKKSGFESLTTFEETVASIEVRHPGNKLDGKISHQVFSKLPMMAKEHARKLLERKAIKTTERTAFDLGLVSHMPQGKPYVALIAVMDGRFQNSNESLLSTAYVDLSKRKARLMMAPLVNFPLSEEDINDFVDNLYITTIFFNIGSIRSGAPIFSYGVIEAAEHWTRANWTRTQFLGDWDLIQQGINQRGGRVLAGLNLQSVASAPLDEEFPHVCEEIQLNTQPDGMGEQSSLTTQGQILHDRGISRSYSLRGPGSSRATVCSFRKTLPIVKNWQDNSTPARFSVSDTYSGMTEETTSSVYQGSSIFSAQSFIIPKDTIAGKVLCDHLLWDMAKDFNGELWHHLLTMQNFTGLFSFDIDLNLTPLAGLSVGVCFDFFHSLDLTVLKDVPIKACALLPNFVFEPGQQISGSINFPELMGHAFSAHGSAFGRGRIIVYTTTNSATTTAEDFAACLTVHLKDVKSSSFLLEPLISLPEFTTDERHNTIGIGRFFRITQGSAHRIAKFDLDFARWESVLTGKKALCSTAAIQSILSGQEGELDLTFFKLGSALIQGGFLVSSWWDNLDHPLLEVLKTHYVRLPKGVGNMRLPIKTPFGRIPVHEKKAQVQIFFSSPPVAPTGVAGDYIGYLQFNHFIPKEFIPKVVNAGNRFAWCQIHSIPDTIYSLLIPARLCDLVIGGATVVMWNNHLHNLVGTTGFFTGTIKFIFSIAYKKPITGLDKNIQLQALFGSLNDTSTWHHRSSHVSSCFSTTVLTHELICGDFSGATTSGSTGFRENFLQFWTNAATHINYIDIDVEVKNMSFYGRKLIIKDI
uniref:Polyprotein n=1 Tax=Nitraria roborowskii nepovirus TaxID=3115772 RepID=A0AAT9JHK5_9SECO